jgi:hypothetical protein
VSYAALEATGCRAAATIDAIGNLSERGRAVAAMSLVLDQRGQHGEAESLLRGAASQAKEDAGMLVNLAEGYRQINATVNAALR